MSSKRVLYKPAPESSGVRSFEDTKSRKPLSQGRLVNSGLPDSLTTFASPTTKQSKSTSRDSPLVSTSYSPADQSMRRSPPPASTSSSKPTLLGPQSPPKPSPSRALDLSDSEYELHSSQVSSGVTKGSSSVLVVDASGGRLDPQDAGVMVQTGVVQSPAKVICHAPLEGQEPDPRDTGSVDHAAKIPVDQVPSSMVPTRGPSTPSSGKKLVFEDTDESAMSDVHDSLALKDSLLIKDDSTESLRVEKDSSTVKERKKKKSSRSAHYVPSRYMQSFSKVSANTSHPQTGPKSKPLTRTASKASKPSDKLMKKPLQKPPVVPPSSSRPKKTKSRRSLMPPPLSETPLDRVPLGKDMFTSTPAMDGSFFPENVSNISSIGHDLSVLREDPTADLGTRLDDTVNKKGRKGDAHHQREVTQFELDKMYARYMQWVFLDSKMQKVKQDKEKDAMLQLYLLHQENEKLYERKTELEMKQAKLTHANNLDQLLDIQKSGLGPIGSHLRQFQSEYSLLAEALDHTRHQIGTTGIKLPQNEEVFQDDLLTALTESEQLLTNISSALQENRSKTSTFAKTIQALETTVAAEDKELQRCQQLLAQSSLNATHETSLLLHQLEGRMAE